MQTGSALTSEDVVEALVLAISRPGSTEVDRGLFREALQGLVRLAQAEQLLRMQLDFDQLTNPVLPRQGISGPAN